METTGHLAITIADFTAADECAVLDLCRDIFAEFGWPLEFMDANVAEGFDRPRDLFLVAKRDDAVVGCAGLKELSAEEALLTRFFVFASLRGTGLAALLFEEVVRRARDLGYAWIVLDVNRESARAIRSYEKQGMERFIPDPHPRWLESAPEERRYAEYFRLRL
jgi:GNAT superfamily N-acetyltransferase